MGGIHLHILLVSHLLLIVSVTSQVQVTVHNRAGLIGLLTVNVSVDYLRVYGVRCMMCDYIESNNATLRFFSHYPDGFCELAYDSSCTRYVLTADFSHFGETNWYLRLRIDLSLNQEDLRFWPRCNSGGNILTINGVQTIEPLFSTRRFADGIYIQEGEPWTGTLNCPPDSLLTSTTATIISTATPATTATTKTTPAPTTPSTNIPTTTPTTTPTTPVTTPTTTIEPTTSQTIRATSPPESGRLRIVTIAVPVAVSVIVIVAVISLIVYKLRRNGKNRSDSLNGKGDAKIGSRVSNSYTKPLSENTESGNVLYENQSFTHLGNQSSGSSVMLHDFENHQTWDDRVYENTEGELEGDYSHLGGSEVQGHEYTTLSG